MKDQKEKQPLACGCGSDKLEKRGGGRWFCVSCQNDNPENLIWVDTPASVYRPLPELIADRLKEENRTFLADKINKELCINFPHSEPIAIVAFGDPHLDDKGTKLSRVIEDLEHVKNNENTFGVCVGDITNNWVGRLQALYGDQNTGVAESWMLLEWFCTQIPWLSIVLGNHDKWNDGMALLKQLTKGKMVQADECSYDIVFKNGARFSINSRHKWKGNSMYNPVHAISKHAQFGNDYDIILGGHTHVSAYAQVLSARSRRISHCIQLSSYKELDSYARTEGFKEHNIAPSMCIVIDPNATREEDKVTCVYSVENGLALHKALLDKYRSSQRVSVSKKSVPVKRKAGRPRKKPSATN